MLDDSLRSQIQRITKINRTLQFMPALAPIEKPLRRSCYQLLQSYTKAVEVDIYPPLLCITMNVFPLVQEGNEFVISHGGKLRDRFNTSRCPGLALAALVSNKV